MYVQKLSKVCAMLALTLTAVFFGFSGFMRRMVSHALFAKSEQF